MKGWIEVTNLKSGKPELVNVGHIRSVSAAMQPGNAYGYLTVGDTSILTRETYSQLKELIEEALK